MAEFCLKCWNELNETNEPEGKYVMSKGLDLCEGCGEWKHVIVRRRGILTVLYALRGRVWAWAFLREIRREQRRRGMIK